VYLDEIKEQTQFTLDSSRFLGQELCLKNNHFLIVNPKNLVFHKNLDVFFLRFPNTHAKNTLLIYDTPYKSIFNDLCSVVFLELFESSCNNGEIHLLFIVFNYLVSFHSFRFNVRHNPFGTVHYYQNGV